MTTRRTATAVLVTASVVAVLTPAAAQADPPSVQVVLPVVDGGVTVIVAPGTPPGVPAPSPTPAPPQIPTPPPPVEPTTQTPPSWPHTHAPADGPTPSDPGSDPPPAGTPPTIPAPVTTASGVTSPNPTAHVTAADPDPAGVPSSPVSDGVPPSPPLPPVPTWAPLPSARPTYVTPTTAPSGPPTNHSSSPGEPFLLGVFAHSTERVDRFEEKVGRDVQVLGVFPARGSWASIMDTWWLDRAPEGFSGVLDVGVPLWQEDGDLGTAAAGGYNAEWEELGRVIHARYPGSTVRIGWEFNLAGWNHHATDENVEEWKQAFRHASTSLKKGGPSLLVDWNPNKGRGDSLADATKAWPGDDVVDIVGLDAYDWWPAYSESTWPGHRDGDQGWQFWVDFARAHGKRFAVPEWGVAPGNDHGGGDNPYYIGVVMDFLAAEHAKDGIVHSAVYFDEPEAYIANSIADGQVPMAGEALTTRLRHLGGGVAPTTSGVTGTSGAASTRPVAEPSTPTTPAATPPADPQATDASTDGSTDRSPGGTRPEGEETADPGVSWSSADGHGPVPR